MEVNLPSIFVFHQMCSSIKVNIFIKCQTFSTFPSRKILVQVVLLIVDFVVKSILCLPLPKEFDKMCHVVILGLNTTLLFQHLLCQLIFIFDPITSILTDVGDDDNFLSNFNFFWPQSEAPSGH